MEGRRREEGRTRLCVRQSGHDEAVVHKDADGARARHPDPDRDRAAHERVAHLEGPEERYLLRGIRSREPVQILGLGQDKNPRAGKALKAARGNLHGLKDADLMAQKTATEQAFQDRVMADKKLAEQHSDLWDRIAGVVEQRRLHEARVQFHTSGGGLLDVAVDIVRLCDPTETEEHRKQARKKLDVWKWGEINSNFHGDAFSLDHLVRARTWLPKNDPFFTKVLGGKRRGGIHGYHSGKPGQVLIRSRRADQIGLGGG